MIAENKEAGQFLESVADYFLLKDHLRPILDMFSKASVTLLEGLLIGTLYP